MSIKSWNKTLANLREKHQAKAVIWWRRKYFTAPEFREREPKWHVFKDRYPDPNDKYSYIWESLCGYTHRFSEYMLEEFPQIKSSGKPIKSAQCLRCRNELEKGNAQHKESDKAERSDLPKEKGRKVPSNRKNQERKG